MKRQGLATNNIYLKLMLKYHPDKAGNKYLEKCKQINKAYEKIIKNDYNEDAMIPSGFRNMGFDKIPTADEYVRTILGRRKLTWYDLLFEGMFSTTYQLPLPSSPRQQLSPPRLRRLPHLRPRRTKSSESPPSSS